MSPIDPIYIELFNLGARKGDLKRIEIIEAAIDCINQVGIENLTFESIGKLIDTNPSHIAYYFPDKNEINKWIIKLTIAKTQAYYISKIRTASSPEKQLEAYVRAAFDGLTVFPKYRVIITTLFYLCSRKLEYRKLYVSAQEAGITRITAIVEPMYRNDPRVLKELPGLSREIIYMVHGNLLQACIHKSKKLQNHLREKTVKSVLALLP